MRTGSVCKNYLIALTLMLALGGAASAGEPLRDPTRPVYLDAERTGPSDRAPRFNVSAIFVSEVRRIAVLNGRTVTIGDRVDGATITAIEQDRVRLAYGGRTFSAELKTPRIRE